MPYPLLLSFNGMVATHHNILEFENLRERHA